jgi:hypothetical protein
MTPWDNGGRPIVGYRVQSAPAGTAMWTTRIENTGSPATGALVTGLVAGAGVQFRAAAITVIGAGPYSTPSAAVVPTAPASSQPPGPAGKDLVTVPPARLLDTRQPNSTIDGLHAGGGPAPAGSVTEVQITGRGGVPADAIAAIVNVTVVGPERDGFATMFPCLPVPPTASNLNYATGHDIPNGAVVQLSPHGTVCVFTDASAHLLIDVNGYLPPGTTVGTLAPARLLDTRQPNSTVDGLNAGGGPTPAGTYAEVQVTGRGGVPQNATSAIVNVTVVGAEADGYAAVFNCETTVPTASNVNYTTGRDIPNNAISKLSPSGTLCIYTYATAHLLVDVSGYAS